MLKAVMGFFTKNKRNSGDMLKPFTNALTVRSEELEAETRCYLDSVFDTKTKPIKRVNRGDKIRDDVVTITVAIVCLAVEGAEFKLPIPGENRIKDETIIFIFSLIVFTSLYSNLKNEFNHLDKDEVIVLIVQCIFLLHSKEEQALILNYGIENFKKLAGSQQEGAKEMFRQVSTATTGFVLLATTKDSRLTRINYKTLFGKLFTQFVRCTE